LQKLINRLLFISENRRTVFYDRHVEPGAKIVEKQIALVYVDRESLEENDAVGLYYSARSRSQIQQGRKQSIDKGELLEPDLTGKAVDRFAKF
jgi:hypothetical protein